MAIPLTLLCIPLAAGWFWFVGMTYAFAGGFPVPHRSDDLTGAPLAYGVLYGAPIVFVLVALLAIRFWKIKG